jgi:FAD-dependent urate hydroxylase
VTLAQAREVSPEEWLRVLRNAFAADRTSAAAIIAATSPADLMVIGGLEIMPTAPVWSHGRSVIVGDAANVPFPSSGQGASMAIESVPSNSLAVCVTCRTHRRLPHTRPFGAIESPALSDSPPCRWR